MMFSHYQIAMYRLAAVTSHKEESMSSIMTDSTDRENIRNKLAACINPLNSTNHPPDNPINIVTGKIAPKSVKVDNSVQLGQ